MNKHYCSVFHKKKEEKLPEDYAWSLEDIDWVSDIKFSVNDIRQIIKKINSTAAGPLGISPLLLKKTEKVMAPMIWRWCMTVFDMGILPSINILSIINPLLKPGKPVGDPACSKTVFSLIYNHQTIF